MHRHLGMHAQRQKRKPPPHAAMEPPPGTQRPTWLGAQPQHFPKGMTSSVFVHETWDVASTLAPSPSRTSQSPQGRATLRRVLLACVVVMVAGFVAVNHVRDSIERRVDREPLRAAQIAAAATGHSIVTVPSALAARWQDSNGPRRSVAQRYVGAGNGLLQPAFYALFTRHGADAPPTRRDWDCLYLAAQPRGVDFDAAHVTDLLQVCYLGRSQTPISVASTAASD